MKKQNKSLIAILALTGFMLILFTGCKKEDPVELPAVNTIIISNITQTSAHSGGNITSDGGADIHSRGLVWSTSANPSIENHTGMSLEGAGIGIFVSMMTALEPETTYYVRAYASNAHKTGYGEQLEFTTEGMIVTDIDGNVYPTVIIGNQEWIAENMRVTRYRNGDVIPTGLNNDTWLNTTSGAYAIYPHGNVDGINSEAEMVDAYGKYYNWYAVVDERGLCPVGWSVASDDDWKQLEMYLGMSEAQANSTGWRGGPVGGYMKATQTDPDPHPRWNSPNTGATNESGFSGVPGGTRGSGAIFHSFGTHSWWWVSTGHGADNAWNRVLRYDYNSVFRGHSDKSIGFSEYLSGK